MSNTCFPFSKHFSIENSALAEITSQPYSIDSIRSDNKKAMLCVRLSATAAAAQPFIYLVIYSLVFFIFQVCVCQLFHALTRSRFYLFYNFVKFGEVNSLRIATMTA